MIQVQTKVSTELLQPVSSRQSEVTSCDSFQQLLNSIVGSKQQTGGRSTEKPAKAGQKTDAQQQSPDDTAVSLTAAQAEQPQPQVQEQTPEGQPGIVAETASLPQPQLQTAQAAVPQPMEMSEAQQTPAQTQTGGDILSMQTVVETVKTPQIPEPTAAVYTTAQPLQAQTRFDDMLAGARRELQGLVQTKNTQTEQSALVTQQTAEPMPAPESEQTEAAAQAVVTTETTGDAPQPKAEVEIPDTAEPEEKQDSPTVTKLVQTDEPSRTEQKPLSKMQQTDQATMEIAEIKTGAEPLRAQTPQSMQYHHTETGTDQMQQVHTQMTEQLDQGIREFTMQLHPEELGKINVVMVLEDGRLAVEIAAASPRAAELLKAQSESLVAAMRLQNIEVQTVSVVTETETASGHMYGALNMSGGEEQNSEQDGGQSPKGFSTPAGSGEEDEQPKAREKAPEALLDYAV